MPKQVLVFFLIMMLIVVVACTKEEGYKITTKVVGGAGNIEVAPNKRSYRADEQVKVNAVPAEGYTFLNWTGDLKSNNKQELIIIAEDITLGAKFAKESSPINIEKIGEGRIEITPSSYEWGEEITLTAAPDTSSLEIWKFEGWAGDISGSENPTEMIIEEEMNIIAKFARYYNKVIEVSGKGTITLEPDKEQYKAGTKIKLTANPDPGYNFTAWGGDISGGQKSKEITVTDSTEADKIKIKANFKAQSDDPIDPSEQYTVITEVIGKGDVELSPNKQKYEAGAAVEVRAKPASNFTFVSWAGDLTGTENPKIITITEDMSIRAEFEEQVEQQFALTTETKGVGSITLDPNKNHYLLGEKVTVTAEGLNGYDFVKWTGKEFTNEKDASKIITITRNLHLEALFELPLTFSDEKLKEKIREEIDKGEGNIYPSDFSSLQELEINYSNSIEDISPLAKADLSNLTVLDLSANKIKDISPLAEMDLSNLNVLKLGGNKIVDLKALTEINLNNLNRLYLNRNEIVDINPVVDMKFNDLDTIYLRNNLISDLSPLKKTDLNNIEYLDLGYNEIENIQPLLNIVANANNSVHLALQSNLITDLSPLAQTDLDLSNLEDLWIEDNNINDISPLAEANLRNLNELDLSSNAVDMHQLASVMNNLNNLAVLSLNNNSLQSLNLLANSDLSNLEKLWLRNNEITDISPLLDTDMSNLETIYLDNNGDIKNQAVIDQLEAAGISISTAGCNIITKELAYLLTTINQETSFIASASYDKDNYPIKTVIQVHGSGELYTIYLEEGKGGIAHLNSDLDQIGAKYECLSMEDIS